MQITPHHAGTVVVASYCRDCMLQGLLLQGLHAGMHAARSAVAWTVVAGIAAIVGTAVVGSRSPRSPRSPRSMLQGLLLLFLSLFLSLFIYRGCHPHYKSSGLTILISKSSRPGAASTQLPHMT
jgi:hypothetical protein